MTFPENRIDYDLPRQIKEWLKQPGSRLGEDERLFIQCVRHFAGRSVGYGFMQQVCEWEWQAACERDGLPGSAWGPEYFHNSREKAVLAEREACVKLVASAETEDEYCTDPDGEERSWVNWSRTRDKIVADILARGKS